jgi:aromatic ring-opening dioxygenase catalytic subunit (LigB family)
MAARMPVVFVPHGGGPWPFVEMGLPKHELETLAAYLRGVHDLPPEPPKALLVVSAHWEEEVPSVMTSPRPPMLFDYYGFPDESYQLSWPAPGSPALAARVRTLLDEAGILSAEDDTRGFDHGTFVPLMLTYPKAEVPAIQLSLKKGLDPTQHIEIGRALQPLRDEGIFIVASGMTFHNLRAMRHPSASAVSEAFDGWLRGVMAGEPEARNTGLVGWASAPGARQAHPREEHLLPLMVAAGAAGNDRAVPGFAGTAFGVRLSSYHFGVLS